MKVPPPVGTRAAKRSTTSVEGVMGYPAANLAPTASAPSQQAWSPSRKCVPVKTPWGSAFIFHTRLRDLISVDGEVRAIHAAEIAAAAFLRMHDVRSMVTLRIEGGRKRQHVRGAKLHAKAAGLAALNDDRNTSLCHEIPQLKSDNHSRNSIKQDGIMLWKRYASV